MESGNLMNYRMTIGIASPISSGLFCEYLYNSYKDNCSKLSTDYAPAVTTLCKELLNEGHTLIIFTLDPKADRIEVLKGDKITIYIGPSVSKNRIKRFFDPLIGRNLRLVKRLFGMNKEKLDVISVHWTREYAIVARKFASSTPVFVTVRDIIPYIISTQKKTFRNYKWWIIWIMNELVMRSRHLNFIANSKYTATMAEKYWKKKIPIIANPIEDRFFNIKYKANLNDNQLVFSTISISQPDDKRKNVATLLKAYQLFRENYKTVVLNLIGQGFTADNSVITEWKSKGLLEGVELKGARSHDEVLEILSNTHLMIHPSLEETFGNTLIEAMAVGCPVLGGVKSGAVPWVLEEGKAGYLCDMTSEVSMSDAITKIISDRDSMVSKSEYAKEFCLRNFSSRNIMRQYVTLFENKLK